MRRYNSLNSGETKSRESTEAVDPALFATRKRNMDLAGCSSGLLGSEKCTCGLQLRD